LRRRRSMLYGRTGKGTERSLEAAEAGHREDVEIRIGTEAGATSEAGEAAGAVLEANKPPYENSYLYIFFSI
jgi:hypothetical protein